MVKKNMTVEVSFPGIEKKSAPVRSLVNFIAENSSLYFRKNDNDGGEETLQIDSFVGGKINENYDILRLNLSSSDVSAPTLVLVSGVLISNSDPSHTLNVYETSYVQMQFPDDLPPIIAVYVIVQSASKVTEVKDDIWNGAENLKVTILSDQSSDKDDLLALAARKNIQTYEFNYEPQSADGNLWKITLADESTAYKKVYVSGIIVVPPPGDTHEDATIIPVISQAELVGEDNSFYIPQTINIESLVISEQPLIEVSTDVKSNISGNIRFDNMVVPYDFGSTGDECYDISALYGKSTAGNKTDIAVNSDSATNFVIDCETYLCKTNSTLAVRKWTFTNENTCDVSETDSFIKLPITITPKINGKVNTDKSVAPCDSLFNNITGTCAIPLSGKVGKYDIQLRTPTFTLCEYDTESEEFISDHDVYYKVGVVPFDGLEETRDKIVKILSNQCIELDYNIPTISIPISLSIALFHADWQDSSYSILPPSNDSSEEVFGNDTMWCSILDLENYINTPLDYTSISEWVPKSMCLTLFDNSTLELKGLVYFKLCNNDGSPFDVELQKPYYVCLKQSEDEIVQPYGSSIEMYMTFTDEKLDGGFIRACNMNFGAYE